MSLNSLDYLMFLLLLSFSQSSHQDNNPTLSATNLESPSIASFSSNIQLNKIPSYGYVFIGLGSCLIIGFFCRCCLSQMSERRVHQVAPDVLNYLPPSDTIYCSICHHTIKPTESQNSVKTTMDCGHFYHLNCIHEYLQTKNTCPICKKVVQLPHQYQQQIPHEPKLKGKPITKDELLLPLNEIDYNNINES